MNRGAIHIIEGRNEPERSGVSSPIAPSKKEKAPVRRLADGALSFW